MFYEIEENFIAKAAEMFPQPNSFTTILRFAETYKRAGMTPFFLTNEDQTIIKCVTRETYNKKLH